MDREVEWIAKRHDMTSEDKERYLKTLKVKKMRKWKALMKNIKECEKNQKTLDSRIETLYSLSIKK